MAQLTVKLLLVLSFTIWCGELFASNLQIHGFADIVGSQSDTNYSLGVGNHDERVVLDPESRLGLNLSADLTDDAIFASQLVARGDDNGVYSINADWIFVTYKPAENWAIRGGRQINPIFLYSEQVDVGYTYLMVRLPNELYDMYPIKSFNGISGIYTHAFNDINFQVQLFGGAGDVKLAGDTYTLKGKASNTRGIEVSFNSDNTKLRAMYTTSTPEVKIEQYDTLSSPPAIITALLNVDFGKVEVYSLGGNFELQKFVGIIEAGEFKSESNAVYRSTAAYGTLGYEITEKLTPYITYAWLGNVDGYLYYYPGPVSTDPTTDTSLWLRTQSSYMLGVNYKANPSLIFKGEFMRTAMRFNDNSLDFDANTVTATMDLIF